MCSAGDPNLLFVNVQEAEEAESPKRSIRDSGYIDCWDSERSDSLSPPRHGREDSFDSLDSLGSRSRQTPSPDVPVTRGSSDGKRRLVPRLASSGKFLGFSGPVAPVLFLTAVSYI